MEKYIAEFLGTMVLVVINNGVVANVLLKNTKAHNESKWLLITIAAGLAVTLGIIVAGFRSGAHINPAVTLAFLINNKIGLVDTAFYIVAQLLGGMTGALLVYIAYKKHYDKTDDESAKLATFSTSPAIRNRFWNILTEIIATFLLVGMVLTITSDYTDIDSSLQPLLIGLLVMVLGISLGGSTGFAMNPARDLGPRITHSILRLGHSDWKYAIVPVVGPIIGGTLGALVFTIYLGGL